MASAAISYGGTQPLRALLIRELGLHLIPGLDKGGLFPMAMSEFHRETVRLGTTNVIDPPPFISHLKAGYVVDAYG